MPNLSVFHPQIVHFVVALLFVGVALRLISLTGKLSFTGPAATVLILLGTIASVLAVKSGLDAHGPAERVPGARLAVQEHEDWGKKARTIFLGVAAFELVALGIRRTRFKHRESWALVASGVLGLAGLWALYEAAEHGGELVYAYAGGVGIRSGEPQDVGRLLVAGLYHQAMLDRREGRPAQAAALIDEMARRSPDDPDVKLLAIESLILDKKDGRAAVQALAAVPIPPDNPRLANRLGLLMVDAWEAAGRADSARAVLQRMIDASPNNQRLKDRLARLP